MESRQRALIEGSGRRTQKLGGAFGPEQRNVLRATRTAAAWRVTESNSLDRSRPLTMSCSRTGTKALAYLADLLSVARQRTGLSGRAGQKRA